MAKTPTLVGSAAAGAAKAAKATMAARTTEESLGTAVRCYEVPRGGVNRGAAGRGMGEVVESAFLDSEPRPEASLDAGLANDPFARLAGFVYRRRWWVLGVWLAAILVCAPFAAKANGVLKAGGVQATGSDSAIAANILDKQFGVSALNNIAIVWHSDKYTVG